jgi:hypothetical protein
MNRQGRVIRALTSQIPALGSGQAPDPSIQPKLAAMETELNTTLATSRPGVARADNLAALALVEDGLAHLAAHNGERLTMVNRAVAAGRHSYEARTEYDRNDVPHAARKQRQWHQELRFQPLGDSGF